MAYEDKRVIKFTYLCLLLLVLVLVLVYVVTWDRLVAQRIYGKAAVQAVTCITFSDFFSLAGMHSPPDTATFCSLTSTRI
jgi:hypothetical protein